MVIIIKKITKFTVDKTIIIPMILFGIISVATIFCTRELLEVESQNLWIKQIFWYTLGFFIAYFLMAIGNKFFYNNAYIFYGIGVISLVLVLFFGKEVNNATCWFEISYI